MKTRSISVLLIVSLLLVLGGSSATAGNPPTIEVITGGVCSASGATATIMLRVSDDMTPAALLNVDAEVIFNPWFVTVPPNPVPGLLDVRWLTVTATPSAPGPNVAIVHVTVTDSSGNSSFVDVFVRAGNQGVNTVTGTDGPDILFGLGMWDTLLGHGGNDLLCGGPGDDTLMGGPGDDSFDCGPGNDYAAGGPGADVQSAFTCEIFLP